MNQRLPLIAILLGVAGLVPFVFCGLGAISSDQVRAQWMLTALAGYGAVILAFLGGVHWGFALGAPEGDLLHAPRVERARLVVGVVPPLIGWAGLLAVVGLSPSLGLGVLIAGFLAMAVVEHRATARGLMPTHYMWLRWALTACVVAMLVTVLTMRLLGQNTGG